MVKTTTLVPRLSGTTSRWLPVQPFQLLPSSNIWRHISLTWPFPLDTSTPDSLSMPWNCFIDFAIEHWFSCHTTESGFARDIGEIWLIDWFKFLNNILYSNALHTLIGEACNLWTLYDQSINQSNFYSANIPGIARLSGATARSVFQCEVVEVVS